MMIIILQVTIFHNVTFARLIRLRNVKYVYILKLYSNLYECAFNEKNDRKNRCVNLNIYMDLKIISFVRCFELKSDSGRFIKN